MTTRLEERNGVNKETYEPDNHIPPRDRFISVQQQEYQGKIVTLSLSPIDTKSCYNAQLKLKISIESTEIPNEPLACLPSETSLSLARYASIAT